METRKITVVSTKDQKKSVIMSAATTLSELKADLRANGIDYDGMTFYEGTSKTELKVDAAVLPHDVPYKGNITNELVFMLTNTNKKIKSGMMSRPEAYEAIKANNLQGKVKEMFGKNFTMCKTEDLIALVENNKAKSVAQPTVVVAVNTPSTPAPTGCVDEVARAAIKELTTQLYVQEYISKAGSNKVLSILGEPLYENTSDIESSYSDDELDDMFDDMDID